MQEGANTPASDRSSSSQVKVSKASGRRCHEQCDIPTVLACTADTAIMTASLNELELPDLVRVWLLDGV